MTTTAHEPRAPAAGGWFTSSRSNSLGECVEVTFDMTGHFWHRNRDHAV